MRLFLFIATTFTLFLFLPACSSSGRQPLKATNTEATPTTVTQVPIPQATPRIVASILSLPPGPPVSPEISTITNTQLMVLWGAPTAPVDGQMVASDLPLTMRATAQLVGGSAVLSSCEVTVTTLHPGDYTCTIENLIPGTAYEIHFISENSLGTNEASPLFVSTLPSSVNNPSQSPPPPTLQLPIQKPINTAIQTVEGSKILFTFQDPNRFTNDLFSSPVHDYYAYIIYKNDVFYQFIPSTSPNLQRLNNDSISFLDHTPHSILRDGISQSEIDYFNANKVSHGLRYYVAVQSFAPLSVQLSQVSSLPLEEVRCRYEVNHTSASAAFETPCVIQQAFSNQGQIVFTQTLSCKIQFPTTANNENVVGECSAWASRYSHPYSVESVPTLQAALPNCINPPTPPLVAAVGLPPVVRYAFDCTPPSLPTNTPTATPTPTPTSTPIPAGCVPPPTPAYINVGLNPITNLVEIKWEDVGPLAVKYRIALNSNTQDPLPGVIHRDDILQTSCSANVCTSIESITPGTIYKYSVQSVNQNNPNDCITSAWRSTVYMRP